MQAVLIKCICLVAFLMIVGINSAAAAGECGKSSPDAIFKRVAFSCLSALKKPNEPVFFCCHTLATEQLAHNPACLCAVVLSNTSMSIGVMPEVGLTIIKRCNFATDRSIGHNCGGPGADTMP